MRHFGEIQFCFSESVFSPLVGSYGGEFFESKNDENIDDMMMIVGIIPTKTQNIVPLILANLRNLDVQMADVFSILGNVTMRMIVVMVPMNRIVITRIVVLENLLAKIIGM